MQVARPNKRLELTEVPDNKNGRRETSLRIETTERLRCTPKTGQVS